MNVLLTSAQHAILTDAAKSPDGTVRAVGFNNGRHSTSTAKAMIARGYLELHPRAYCIYRITPAGRAALADCEIDDTRDERRRARELAERLGDQVRHALMFGGGWAWEGGARGFEDYTADRTAQAAHEAGRVLALGGVARVERGNPADADAFRRALAGSKIGERA